MVAQYINKATCLSACFHLLVGAGAGRHSCGAIQPQCGPCLIIDFFSLSSILSYSFLWPVSGICIGPSWPALGHCPPSGTRASGPCSQAPLLTCLQGSVGSTQEIQYFCISPSLSFLNPACWSAIWIWAWRPRGSSPSCIYLQSWFFCSSILEKGCISSSTCFRWWYCMAFLTSSLWMSFLAMWGSPALLREVPPSH